MQQRIQKIMAHAGVASRRKCEDIIAQGLVKVNGKLAKLGDTADDNDKIMVEGRLIQKEEMVYIILNKPKGFLCSVGDEFKRKTILDLVKCDEKVFPVGRLDMDSEGLLILTNDGDFANSIIHPRYNIRKRYFVILDRPLQKEDFDKIKAGISIDGRKVTVFNLREDGKHVELSIHEGRKHIIKNLFNSLDYDVVNLTRISIGGLKLNLESGKSKFVSKEWLKETIF